MEYLNANSLYMPILTAIGALGMGGLTIPKLFQDLGKNEWFQWLLVFILIMQGGAGGNVRLAALTTVIMYVATKVLDMVYTGKSEGYRSY